MDALDAHPRWVEELPVLIAGSEVSEDPGDGAFLLRVPDGLDLLEVVTMTDGDDPRECHTHYVVRML